MFLTCCTGVCTLAGDSGTVTPADSQRANTARSMSREPTSVDSFDTDVRELLSREWQIWQVYILLQEEEELSVFCQRHSSEHTASSHSVFSLLENVCVCIYIYKREEY